MNVELPTPTAVRERKKRQVRDLLDAEYYLPRLVKRLSSGVVDIDSTTACRWAGWIASLKHDPAWAVVEPALQIPEAWPEVWQRARQAGFSPATEHHQALFFTRLFERASADGRYDLARRTFVRALTSWRALSESDYLAEEVIPEVAPDLSPPQIEEVLSSLFYHTLSHLEDLASDALRIHAWDRPPRRRPLRFVCDVLRRIDPHFDDTESGPVGRGIVDGAETLHERLWRSVADELDRRLQSFDFAVVERDDLVTTLDAALMRCRHLQFPPQLDRVILRRGLAVIWDLREMERDEELEITPDFVERLEPCAERLQQAGDDDSFGLEGAIADLFVFKGEQALSLDARQECFEHALEICPGHRNASRLLSYLLLERANRDLLKTAALPDATSSVGPFRRRITPLLANVEEAIVRAEELYPENDLLDRYRDDLDEEKRRFRMQTEADVDD